MDIFLPNQARPVIQANVRMTYTLSASDQVPGTFTWVPGFSLHMVPMSNFNHNLYGWVFPALAYAMSLRRSVVDDVMRQEMKIVLRVNRRFKIYPKTSVVSVVTCSKLFVPKFCHTSAGSRECCPPASTGSLRAYWRSIGVCSRQTCQLSRIKPDYLTFHIIRFYTKALKGDCKKPECDTLAICALGIVVLGKLRFRQAGHILTGPSPIVILRP
jgi:hypothetical protein